MEFYIVKYVSFIFKNLTSTLNTSLLENQFLFSFQLIFTLYVILHYLNKNYFILSLINLYKFSELIYLQYQLISPGFITSLDSNLPIYYFDFIGITSL